jgi:hypothetical protein
MARIIISRTRYWRDITEDAVEDGYFAGLGFMAYRRTKKSAAV